MNKTVLITGGAKGIGREIAIDFKNNGYNVCITYNKSLSEAKTLEGIDIYKLDINCYNNVDSVVKEVVKKYGKIDCLVNNSGIAEYSLINEISELRFKEVIDTNLNSVFYLTKSVLNNSMIDNKDATIINISSVWGIVGASMEVAYSASKAGLIGMTKALAKELAPSNITVNSLSLGPINTDMLNKFSDEDIECIENDIPIGRIGKVTDVSKVVLFLASDGARYITGQNICVDGGMCI